MKVPRQKTCGDCTCGVSEPAHQKTDTQLIDRLQANGPTSQRDTRSTRASKMKTSCQAPGIWTSRLAASQQKQKIPTRVAFYSREGRHLGFFFCRHFIVSQLESHCSRDAVFSRRLHHRLRLVKWCLVQLHCWIFFGWLVACLLNGSIVLVIDDLYSRLRRVAELLLFWCFFVIC